MSWFTKRRRAQKTAQAEADQALKESVADLHSAVIAGEESRSLAARLRELRHHNHFAESIHVIYRGEPT